MYWDTFLFMNQIWENFGTFNKLTQEKMQQICAKLKSWSKKY